MCHCVHSCSHLSQILEFIYADGPVLRAAANDMLVTSQNALELQCRGAATLDDMRNLSATNACFPPYFDPGHYLLRHTPQHTQHPGRCVIHHTRSAYYAGP